MPNRSQVLAREREWSTRCGVAALAGAFLTLAGLILLQSALTGDTNFEGLEGAHEEASTVWLSGIATGLGYLLLGAPLLLLFRAAQARSSQVRNQLVGVVMLGPLLLGIAGVVLAGASVEAADNYVEGKATPTLTAKEAARECRSEAREKGAEEFARDFPAGPGSTPSEACQREKLKEDEASEAINDASLIDFARYTGLAGGLALVVALFYSCLHAMRVGLLTRFWGSLGMAVGIAALIGFSPLVMVWFIYFGLLLIGKVPGGRPPAWEAGEAVPWPTPGEKAAAELEPEEAMADEGDGSDPSERRKRKQRES
jgi:hypothetical protein